MYKIKSIGTVRAEDSVTVIEVSKEYRKALKFLNEFSHIHVFYLTESESGLVVKKNIIAIKELNERSGRIVATAIKSFQNGAELIDIKPYFPSEDTVKSIVTSPKKNNDIICIKRKEDKVEKKSRKTLKTISGNQSEISVEVKLSGESEKKLKDETEFEINEIGRIRNVNGKIYIQLQQMVDVTSRYVTVFWWFDKFDSDQYRRATQCNPPYENAPRTGIFATRSPVRPNPIAMTIVHIVEVDVSQKRIYINNIESYDQTPCIGISEYHSKEDCIRICSVPSWLKHWPKSIDETVMEQAGMKTEVKNSALSELLEADVEKGSALSELLVSYDEEKEQNSAIQKLVCDNSSMKTEQRNVGESMLKRPTEIMVYGARENNLQGINVSIPYGKLTAVVGVSGSGKSSLVNQTIYAECRRRMEYISHSINIYQKPLVDEMTGCIPAVVIRQDAIRGNIFSTVGTYTDAYDYLRKIFAAVAVRHCPACQNEMIPMSKDRIYQILRKQPGVVIYNLSDEEMTDRSLEKNVEDALRQGEGAFYAQINRQDKILMQTRQKCYHCNKIMFEFTPATFSFMDPDSRCPVCSGTGQKSVIDRKKLIEYPERSLLEGASSFYGKLRNFQKNPNANWMKGQVFGLAEYMNVDLDEPWECLPKAFQTALLFGYEQEVTFSYVNKKNGRKGEIIRQVEGIYKIIERLLEENDSSDMLKKYLKNEECYACHGERLAGEGRMATLIGKRYPEAANMTFAEIIDFCKDLQRKTTRSNYERIAASVDALLEIAETAVRLGVGHLPLSQETGTLSGGEGQRLKLIGAFKNHMSGILYIFDEPSKGLHPKDYQKIMALMKNLILEGNTIIMVEHNEDMIRVADNVIEIGPGAGEEGGFLAGEGTLTAMLGYKETQISKYMNAKTITERTPKMKKKDQQDSFFLANLTSNNLKNISVSVPLRALTCICGVSGSGKSTLMKKEIFLHAQKMKQFSSVVMIDQTAIGKNSKSIIATYIGIMDFIRSEYADTAEAVANHWEESYFSFNSPNGQCDTCKGDGKIKMKYTEDIVIECPDCNGTRYKNAILEVKVKGRNIAEILKLSVNQAIDFFKDAKQQTLCLQSLQRVGLGYLKLGQGTSTLSGGEASRLRLAKELLVKSTGNVLYLLDEPTTGLHFSDVENLLILVADLICNGNTVVAIEHNKQFLQQADWKIELGPGAGKEGGFVL